MARIDTVRDETGMFLGFCVVWPGGKSYHRTLRHALQEYERRTT